MGSGIKEVEGGEGGDARLHPASHENTNLTTTQKELEAVRLRLAGKSNSAIAKALDVSRGTVARYLRKALAASSHESAASVAAMREAMRQRYETLVEILWPQVKESPRARTQLLEVMRDMRKLHGLDRPTETKAPKQFPDKIVVKHIEMEETVDVTPSADTNP